MPINTPVVIEIDRKTWLIQEYGLSCCYALLGNESGLLIDTGRKPSMVAFNSSVEMRLYSL